MSTVEQVCYRPLQRNDTCISARGNFPNTVTVCIKVHGNLRKELKSKVNLFEFMFIATWSL